MEPTEGRILDEQFYHRNEDLCRAQQQGEISRDHVVFTSLHGFDTKKRNNLYYLDDQTLLTSAGNSAQIIDVNTLQRKHVFGFGGGGVGAITMHPSKKYFAVGDKGNKPIISIYEYPSLQVFRVLKNGTERGYSSLRFSNDGMKLASVGAYPDFLLTVWNWREEQTILRCKAFGQEVFNVQFSPNDSGFLTTSGTGHIRFWKMASTFTGLKLQGDIAKFGKSELSDIEAFCVLPDKKVLSSTERGALLLWDGNFIKCEIVTFNRQRAHNGPINVVLYEPELNQILTAGSDGMLKWWHFPDIDQADVQEDDTVAEVIPKDEFCVTIKSPHHASFIADIRGVVRGENHYMIQDGNGYLHRYEIDTRIVTSLFEYHAGAITGLGTSPKEHVAATCGMDGTVRCWDYVASKPLFSQRFNCPATALVYAPPTHDPSGKLVAVGFHDGVIRILERGSSSWHRVQVIKPHNQPINCISYAPNGAYFITASVDHTLFIFSCTTLSKYEPIGFKALSNAEIIRHVSWRWDSKAVLVTSSNGTVGEIEIPSTTDSDKPTYELNIPFKQFQFRRIRKLSSTELANLVDDSPADTIKPTQYNPSPLSNGSCFGEIEVTTPTPPRVLAAMYCCLTPFCFIISVGDVHSGYLYKCDWNESFPLEMYPDDPHGSTQTLVCSHSNKFILAGNLNGKVHIRNRVLPYSYLTWELHDQSSGGTACVAMSYDDSFVLAGGSDGQLSIVRILASKVEEAATRMNKQYELILGEGKKTYQSAHDRMCAQNDVRVADEPVANVFVTNPIFAGAKAYMAYMESYRLIDNELYRGSIRSIESCEPDIFPPAKAVNPSDDDPPMVKEAPDITHKDAYTIQDAKLKLEADIHCTCKQTRGIIAELREQFNKLRELDASHEPIAQLEEWQWNIDPEYVATLLSNGDKQCDEVRKEMAYAYEKSELLLSKMRNKYVGNLAVELITLHGFQNQLYVQSFRTTKMSEELQENLRIIHLELQENLKHEQNTIEKKTVLDYISKSKLDDIENENILNDENNSIKDSEINEISSHRFEYRKKMRMERKQKIKLWEGKKPKEEADDPRDVAAISFATNNMEDYKLKTSANYVVPEEQRVNAMKKRKQMALLEEKMYEVAMTFNAKILELRELKHRLMEQINQDNNQLKQLEMKYQHLSGKLMEKNHFNLFEPKMNFNEWPEQRERVLDCHLEEYEKHGMVSTNISIDTCFNPTKVNDSIPSMIHPVLSMEKFQVNEFLSPFEEQQNRIQCIQLKIQRDILQEKINTSIRTFDEAIYRLRREKLKLDIALKKGQFKLMIRLGELVLLEQFESKENLLVSKLEKCKTDKAQVVRELTDCNDQFLSKRKEMEECQINEQTLQNEFIGMVGTAHPCFTTLQKIYKKKLKRQKKRVNDDDDQDEDEESEDEYNSNDDDDDNDTNEEEMCPSGCEMALYERVLALREKKADIDDAMGDITKSIDDLKRSNDRHIQKQRQIDKELTATEQDIQAFQTEKQMRFNELDVIVALSKQQLRCMQPKDASPDAVPFGIHPSALFLPETVENALVFNNSVVQRLSHRILSLQDENRSLRQVFKDLHKQQSQLLKDKARQNETIGEIDEKCTQLQMLKFGRLIDIDLLDKACDTGNLNDLKSKVRSKELHGEKQLADSKGEQQRLKMEILKATEENTRLLTEIAALSERQFSLEKELNQADVNNTLADDSTQLEHEMHERKKLVELVKLQSREIEALKQEVLMLRGKKGRVHASIGMH